MGGRTESLWVVFPWGTACFPRKDSGGAVLSATLLPGARSHTTHHTCWISAQAHAGEEQVSLSNGGVCPWGALGAFQKQQHMTCRGQKAKSQSSKGPGYQWNLFVVREVWWYLSYSKIYRNPGCPFNKVLLSTYSAHSTALGAMKTTREM